MKTFKNALISLINIYSLENKSGTPDFILAKYLLDCLRAFENATNKREKWYTSKIGQPIQENQ